MRKWLLLGVFALYFSGLESAEASKKILCRFPAVVQEMPECVGYAKICSKISETLPGPSAPDETCIDFMTLTCKGETKYSGLLTVGLIPDSFTVLQGFTNLDNPTPPSITIETHQPLPGSPPLQFKSTLILHEGPMKEGGCEYLTN